MATRDATAQWSGTLKEGSGTMSVSSGAFSEQKFSFKTRFEDEPGTNPEELVAAAHAGCYSMALSAMLSQDGHPPESIRTTAKVHLRVVDDAPTITKVDLHTEGTVPGIDAASFEDYAKKAKEGCIISRALGAVDEITLEASFAG